MNDRYFGIVDAFFYRDRNRHLPIRITKSITAACLRRGMPFLTPSLIFLPLSPPAAIDFFKQSARDSIFRDSGETSISPYVLYIYVYILVYFYSVLEKRR